MLLALILILVLIGAAVIGSIYSNFVVFYSNFSESENYHKAYYASISALERGELVTKQRSPGYVGSGGFRMGSGMGGFNNSDGGSDKSLSGFSYLGDNADISSVFRTVNSRTTRIPATSGGDVERMLSAADSPNYNMMGYENSEVFLLYVDNLYDMPYKTGGIEKSNPDSINGVIRLPELLKSRNFGDLDTGNSLVGIEGQIPPDDAIVDWQIRGETSDDGKPFTIYSTQTVSRNMVHYLHDSIFRESDINGPLVFKFSNQKSSPIFNSKESNHNDNDTEVTVISENASDIISMFTGGDKFEYVFGLDKVSLRFSLLNLLETVGSGHHYPFLEYYAEFFKNGNPVNVSDKYYTIDGEGNFKDFQVNTVIKKPTVKETVLGNFTSIF